MDPTWSEMKFEPGEYEFARIRSWRLEIIQESQTLLLKKTEAGKYEFPAGKEPGAKEDVPRMVLSVDVRPGGDLAEFMKFIAGWQPQERTATTEPVSEKGELKRE